jgi:hypothetical protein
MMKWAKGRCFVGFLVLAAWVGASAPALFADDPEARAIMERVDGRDDGDNETADVKMILVDKKNQERVRKIARFMK